MAEPQYRLEGIVRTRTEEMEDFEGPLDVIFLLLSKNKIEIEDVSITAILEQYLAYLDEMKRLDMEIASEFITMASHLMLIKTKMLLSAAEAQEAQDELDVLRQSLIERQRKEAIDQIRVAINWLEPRNEIGRCIFIKDPEPLRKDQSYRYQHDSTPVFSTKSLVSRRPAVSKSLAGIPSKLIQLSIKSRVVPSMSETIARSSFKRMLNKLDFPALVFPQSTIRAPSW